MLWKLSLSSCYFRYFRELCMREEVLIRQIYSRTLHLSLAQWSFVYHVRNMDIFSFASCRKRRKQCRPLSFIILLSGFTFFTSIKIYIKSSSSSAKKETLLGWLTQLTKVYVFLHIFLYIHLFSSYMYIVLCISTRFTFFFLLLIHKS